jgi:uncharacterized protein
MNQIQRRHPESMLKKSRWTHVFHSDEDQRYFLFHAVNMDVIEVDADALRLLDGFDQPVPVQSLPSLFKSPEERAGIKALSELGFLVTNDLDESALFEKDSHGRHRQASTLNKVSKIASARILLTEECNMRCKYCFIDHSPADAEFDTIRRILDQVLKNSSDRGLSIQFFGGEPLLKFGLMKKAVEYIKELPNRTTDVYFKITTNATLVNREIASFLAKHDFEVAVSIDGTKEINDQNRVYRQGSGTFDQTIRGFKTLKENGCKVGFLLTPIFQNQGHIATFFREAIQLYRPSFLAVNTPQPSETGWNVDGVTYAKDMIECYHLAVANNTPFTSTLTKVFVGLIRKERCVSTCFDPSGDRVASFTVKGEVSPCIVGWQKEFLRPLEALHDPSTFNTQAELRQPRECQKCPALNVCGGPCHLEDFFYKKSGMWDHNRCDFFEEALKWAVGNMDLIRENI